MTDHAELIESLTEFAKEQDESAAKSLSSVYRVAFQNEAKLLREAATALAAVVAEKDALIADICRVVDGARPYKDESGVIEIPLHTFGILFRIRDEARAALAQGGGQ